MRGISLSAHSAIEVFAAPAIMVAPFVLGFGPAATVLAVVLGVTLLGLALQLESPSRTIPLRTFAEFDYLLALGAAVGGIAVGVVTGEWNATVFLVGIAAALVTLTVATRFSTTRNA